MPDSPLAPNDRYYDTGSVAPLSSDEVRRVIGELVRRLAVHEGVDVTSDVVTVMSCERRVLHQPVTHEVTIRLVPTFGAADGDYVRVELRRVTEPVNVDDSLITSQSTPVSQTDDQHDETTEEK